MTEPRTRKPRTKTAVAGAEAASQTPDMVSTKPPRGHPDYEFPKEVHNLLVVAQQGHVALSSMADTKASILMTATFVVFGMALNDIADSAT
ncbi:MAG: hypothetical protein EON96_12215 [Caulobacteraceae bacterium]|nr:MAG: hypothetical protein EON96_12215 [Caulobacteraceae bacterium]